MFHVHINDQAGTVRDIEADSVRHEEVDDLVSAVFYSKTSQKPVYSVPLCDVEEMFWGEEDKEYEITASDWYVLLKDAVKDIKDDAQDLTFDGYHSGDILDNMEALVVSLKRAMVLKKQMDRAAEETEEK